MKMQQDNHLSLGGLEEGVFDVIEENVHSVSLQSGVAKAIAVGFQRALYSSWANDWSHVEVL